MSDSKHWRKNMGGRLRELRLSRGLSQQEVADASGLGRECISNYERGERSPDPFTLAQLATVLKVSADYILGRVPFPSGTDDPFRYKLPPAEEMLVWEGEPDLIRYALSGSVEGMGLLRPGDIALVRPTKEVKDGQLALVAIGDEEPSLARIYQVPEGKFVHVVGLQPGGQVIAESEMTVLGQVLYIWLNPHPEPTD